MEANFSLFWGLAIQLYESTLIANDTPFDNNTLNAQQLRGQKVFAGAGRCATCHSGAELTKASVSASLGAKPATGFFNTGVRPVAEDGGIQDVGIANHAMFKTPHLRNVELTGPYFHNGEAATLRQVVDFYNRGGNFRSSFTDGNIRPLGLSEQQKTDLVAFMLALTDARVKNESAPFDHPSLQLNSGANPDGSDITSILPAVGAGGRPVAGIAPLQPFLGLDPFQP
jgi:cytochrome c peroxidase